MANRSSGSFGATDQRVYVTNSRVPVFDFNSEQIKIDLSNNVVPLLQVIANNTGGTGPTGAGGPVTIAPGQYVGISGPVGPISGPYNGLVGVTGAFNTGPIAISANQFIGITGPISVSNFPAVQPIQNYDGVALDVNVITATLSILGDVNVLTLPPVEIEPGQIVDIGNTVTVQGEMTVSGPIQIVGDDYATNSKFPIYVDENGVQRTEIVEGHQETAKYIFETDKSAVVTFGLSGEVFLDARGRPGWYVNNQLGTINFEWYDNAISTPPNLIFNKMQAVWATVYMDDPTFKPYIFVSTGVSAWAYTTSAQLYNGETYLFYYGQKAVALNPNIHPIELTRTLVTGTGNINDVILSITIVLTTGNKTGVVDAGLWNQDLALIFRTTFDNNRDLTARNNLATLSFNGATGPLNTHISSIAANTRVGITGPISSYITDGTRVASLEGITGTYFNAQVLNVNAVQKIRPAGYGGNILFIASIAAWANSLQTSIMDPSGSRLYGANTFISYSDMNQLLTTPIQIWAGGIATGSHAICPNAQPVTCYNTSGVATFRSFSTVANLSFFDTIYIKNEGSTPLTGVNLTILTGNAGCL